jgi:hypothetical protein
METSKSIYKQILAIMSDMEAIGKNKRNDQQKYNFRGIDDMYNALHPLFAKHGVFITSEIVSSSREQKPTQSGGVLLYSIVNVKFTFFAEDGSSVSSTLQGEAMDSGDKATNKAISAALKYALMQMFLIPTEELKDADQTTPEPLADVRKTLGEKALQAGIERIKGGEAELKERLQREYKLTPNQIKLIKAA